ncbi:hypothetical protein [Spirosoma utsteinense]|uniref:hypothetical protein n=1 Tax=Spirosoma utsteinense TaxID=2585773 RepID=UPI001648556B|nr:hypothetical protein [Spirosoma utsteinense]MBC3789301.1 hypothetical protein [Spirosoma utsteinense]
MKKYLLLMLGALLLSAAQEAVAQYTGCPHSGPSGSEVGQVAWRFKNPDTGVIVTGSPQPNTYYQLEIYYSGSPSSYYSTIGIQGSADGFKLYTSVAYAKAYPNNYASDTELSQGTGKDVGANQTAVFGIKTLPASDPNWSGQLTAFKAFGLCYPGSAIGLPNKYYKKTLVFLP